MIDGAIEKILFAAIQESNKTERERIMKNGQKHQTAEEKIKGYLFAAWLSVPMIAVVGLVVYPISLMIN